MQTTSARPRPSSGALLDPPPGALAGELTGEPAGQHPDRPPATGRAGIASIAGMAFVMVGTLLAARSPELDEGLDKALSFEPWTRGQHHFTYEHGFIRRGLPGEVLHLVQFPGGQRPMFLLFTAVYFAIGALLARLAWQATRPLSSHARALMVSLVLVLPFVLPQVAYNLGRYDTLLLLATLPFLIWRAPLWAYAVIGLAGPMVHESFVLVHLPLLIAAVLCEQEQEPEGRPVLRRIRDDRRVRILAGACAVSVVLLMTVGGPGSMTEERFVATIAEDVPDYPSISGPGSLPPHTVLYAEPAEAIERVASELTPANILQILGAMLPLGVLLAAVARLRSTRRAVILRPLALAVLPTLGLFLIGVDFMRWVALGSVSALLVVLLDLRARSFTPTDLQRAQRWLGALAATALLGPVGTTQLFPLWPPFLHQLF